jgi:hypothetical protein
MVLFTSVKRRLLIFFVKVAMDINSVAAGILGLEEQISNRSLLIEVGRGVDQFLMFDLVQRS